MPTHGLREANFAQILDRRLLIWFSEVEIQISNGLWEKSVFCSSIAVNDRSGKCETIEEWCYFLGVVLSFDDAVLATYS